MNINLIKSDLTTKGWSGPHSFFSIEEINDLNKKIVTIYKDFINFPYNENLIKRLELATPKIKKELIPKTLLKDSIVEFSKKNKIVELFKKLLNSKNIKLTEFVDFRLNFPGNEVPQATGWHQDIETFYSHDFDGLNNKSLAMWISLTSADNTNSVEFIEGSQSSRIIYNTVYSDRKKNAEKIIGKSDLTIKSFRSKPGDIVIINPYVLHRSVVQNSNFFRMSIDLRYADLDSLEKVEFKGFKIKLLKFLKDIKAFFRNIIKKK
tara:strand:+ start:705 stop:1496 length:792 start_codon:yes stop_codon:yes gene_type:complete